MKNKSKKYRGNYDSALIVLGGLVIIWLIAAYSQNGVSSDPRGYVLGATLVLLLVGVARNTWLQIEGGILTSSGQSLFPRKLELINAREVRRVRGSIFSSGGAWMAFFGRDGLLLRIRELGYSESTLKRFVCGLKERYPAIELDPQYTDFGDGRTPGDRDFHHIEATHNTY